FGVLIIMGVISISFAKNDGAPSGNTGSPGDDQTCAHTMCHSGTASEQIGLISTNVPASGYLAGETYLVTVTVTEADIVKFGFQASPQNLDGDRMGDMSVIDATETKLTGGGKYITHKSTGTAGSGSRTWTFNWTPDESTGEVGFYVAVNASNNEDDASGDHIYYDAIFIPEDPDNVPVKVDDIATIDCTVNAISNDMIYVQYQASGVHAVKAQIFDMMGRELLDEENDTQASSFTLDTSGLSAGCYLVVLTSGTARFVQQIVLP
ncbi:MAG TPA: T9SS type A sorting domain-containing protein, partial [Chitinophagales bacterium]|nr:T9SS type A sorting domain-containing protein [Chitinophagales bacterium]